MCKVWLHEACVDAQGRKEFICGNLYVCVRACGNGMIQTASSVTGISPHFFQFSDLLFSTFFAVLEIVEY
jgi:hypothetical protein